MTDTDTTTTVRARFASCAEVRSFFADRYHGMVINERMVAKTCENHGLSYTPPERASDDNLNDWWELTA